MTALGVGDGAVDGQAGTNNDGLAGVTGLVPTRRNGFRNRVGTRRDFIVFWSGSGDRCTAASRDVAATGGIDSEHGRVIGGVGDLADDQVTAFRVRDCTVDVLSRRNDHVLAGISGLVPTRRHGLGDRVSARL